MNALHFLSKNFALIAGKKGRLFRKGRIDNENKKAQSFSDSIMNIALLFFPAVYTCSAE